MGKLILGMLVAIGFNLWAQGNQEPKETVLQDNEEIKGKCTKENANFYYLTSPSTKMKYKLRKKGLTPESLPEITKNCKKEDAPEMVLFVPVKSVVNKESTGPKEEEL